MKYTVKPGEFYGTWVLYVEDEFGSVHGTFEPENKKDAQALAERLTAQSEEDD